MVEVTIPYHSRGSRFYRSEDRYPLSYSPLYEYIDVEILRGINNNDGLCGIRARTAYILYRQALPSGTARIKGWNIFDMKGTAY